MKRSGSRFLAALYYHSFRYFPHNAKEKKTHKFNIKQEMDNRYYNLWSADNTKREPNDDVVIKSVYDPSPVGYSLPASNAFTGLTTTGQNVGSMTNPASPEQINAKQPFDRGWYCYTKPGKQGNTIFFQAQALRSYNKGDIEGGNTNGVCWVAGNLDNFASRHLSFNSRRLLVLTMNPRSYGFTVRSAEEKDKLVKIKDLRKNGGHCLF